MKEKNLYLRLKEAYTSENLNKITSMILDVYKKKQYGFLHKMLKHTGDDILLEEEKSSRILASLVMHYHPDRLKFYINKIDKYNNSGDLENLKKFTHIFNALNFDPDTLPVIDPDENFISQYEWDVSGDTYPSYYSTDPDEENEFFEDFSSDVFNFGFFQILKRDIYGGLNIELPFFLLEDIDELDLPDRGMENLDGLEYCKQLRKLDLSNNKLSDISEIAGLIYLEELYLADNQIGYIDALSNLHYLKIVDLSNNQIDDISPLYDLEYLEYIHFSGNPIPGEQLELLKKKEVIVLH